MVAGGWGEGIVREFGKVMCTLLSSKRISNKDHTQFKTAAEEKGPWTAHPNPEEPLKT